MTDLLDEEDYPSPVSEPPRESPSDVGVGPNSTEVSLEDNPLEPLEFNPEEEFASLLRKVKRATPKSCVMI